MSTYTYYPAANDGGLRSTGSDYPSARAGTLLVEFPSVDADYMLVGQNIAKVYEGFLRFDTNSIPDSYTISSVTLATYLEPSFTKTYSIEARAYNWGTTFGIEDFVPGANLAACTLLASYPASSMTSVVTSWYSEIAFSSYVNKSGYTRMVLCSSHTTTNVEPAGAEYTTVRTSEYTGTSSDPCLTVLAVPPSGGHTARIKASRGAIW